MYCTYCGKQIADESAFCPYCGKSTKYEKLIVCPKCGKILNEDSRFCCYCGSNIVPSHKKSRNSFRIPKVNLQSILSSRFLKIYIAWIGVNCLLLYKAEDAYSNYFNSTDVSRDHWLSSDKGIYPEDWLYPFKNIFSGIMGQDPVYVYDISEFILYIIIIPAILSLCMYKRATIFKTEKASCVFYWTVWYLLIWMIIVFPMGLLGLDFLGWSFVMGGLIVGIYSYEKTFAKLYGK